MYYFKKVELTPEEIKSLQETDFETNDISEDGTVDPTLLIQAAGLDDYEMGNLKIMENGAGFGPIDSSKPVTEEEIAMMSSYIKQQVRDNYGVQLILAE